ncbi:MAG: hypothetical protein Q7V20_21295 [Aquabacterium sp.]|uniref:hypothetical protein n=1 Tax=Aquabacterium sp. TaxID=1872578 RepID=UPI0027179EFB|nr:hypothetical protein [Aquabacterium sp.]MDO9005988.1 hypothetical protein [Aquabacterium sp.]
MIALSLINAVVLLLIILIDRKIFRGNVFSPGAIFAYFALLPALSGIYFSFRSDKFDEIILAQLDAAYHDRYYANVALLLTMLSNITVYVGIAMGYFARGEVTTFVFNRVFMFRGFESGDRGEKNIDKRVWLFGGIVFALGLVAYVAFLTIIGGLFALWAELHLRSVKNAGLGYLQTFFMMAIQIGATSMLYISFKYDRTGRSIIIILLSAFVLGSIGARGPVLTFLLSILLLYHFKIKKFQKLISPQLVALSLFVPIFVVAMLQFRGNSPGGPSKEFSELASNSIGSIEQGFIARIGRIERDMVILKYFDDNDFWFGASYLGLIYAPIPRSLFPEKPPNDTGMYLRVMALGDRVSPPQPVSTLGSSGWPEGNWAGYMNWGFPGFFFLFYVSGYLLGGFYGYLVRNNFPIFATCIYSVFAVGGAPSLSVAGLINLAMLFLVATLLMVTVTPLIGSARKLMVILSSR